MTKRTKIIIACAALGLVLICVVISCLSSVSGRAEKAVKKYNDMVSIYNIEAIAYNDAVELVEQANAKLDSVIDSAQILLDSNAIPYDNQCKIELEQAIQTALQAKVDAPAKFPVYEEMTIPQDATDEQLRELAETASSLIKQMEATVPGSLLQPDYAGPKSLVQDAMTAFERSVLVQLQITAPKDEFILERLKQIDTVLAVGAVTKSNDPNGLLGIQGGYIGCIYFSDSRVDKEKLNLKPSEYDVISMGAIGGGAIEIYGSIDDAQMRNTYLSSYDNTELDPGSHVVVGTLVIRTSSMLSKEQQAELTDSIIKAIISLAKQD